MVNCELKLRYPNHGLLFNERRGMSSSTANVFEYKDKNFGDSQGVVVTTSPEVFYPTSTTNLLLAAVRSYANSAAASALDLGCGCGIVAVALAKSIMPKA